LTRLVGASLCALAGISGITSTGLAKPPSAKSEAESVAETAARRFKEGDYELAAQLFLKAWALTKKPAQLFNAARAYEQAGKAGEAISLFEKYIAVETDAGGREEAKLRAERLRESAAHERELRAARDKAAREQAARAKAERERLSEIPRDRNMSPQLSRERERVARVEHPAASAPMQRPGRARVGPWVLAGSGAVVAIVGAVLLGTATSADASLRADTDTRDAGGHVTGVTQADAFARADRNGSRRTAGVVVGALGLGALVGGLGWLLLPSRDADYSFGIAPAQTGLAIGGRF